MPIFRKIASAMIAAIVLAALPASAAEIIDVTGRRVEIALPAKRVLLGEARQIHVAAALKGEHVFDTIVGWREIRVPASDQRVRSISTPVNTVSRGVTGLIHDCWVP